MNKFHQIPRIYKVFLNKVSEFIFVCSLGTCLNVIYQKYYKLYLKQVQINVLILVLIIATFQLFYLPTCSRRLPFRLSFRENVLFNIHSYLLFNLCLSTELTITMIELLIELTITMPENSQLNSFIYEAIIPWNLML